MSTNSLREAAQQALEALGSSLYPQPRQVAAIAALRAALAEPTVKESLTTGSCIACGNRMTGSPESFVVATAEVGVTAPEGYSPQQVEALHPHKGGDKTAPPLAEPVQEPVAWIQPDHLQKARRAPFLCRVEPTQRCADFVPLYAAPPQRKPLTEEEIKACEKQAMVNGALPFEQRVFFARAIERAIWEKNNG